jgi:hypothetical protein
VIGQDRLDEIFADGGEHDWERAPVGGTRLAADQPALLERSEPLGHTATGDHQ